MTDVELTELQARGLELLGALLEVTCRGHRTSQPVPDTRWCPVTIIRPTCFLD